jgi:hypothetical protein
MILTPDPVLIWFVITHYDRKESEKNATIDEEMMPPQSSPTQPHQFQHRNHRQTD